MFCEEGEFIGALVLWAQVYDDLRSGDPLLSRLCGYDLPTPANITSSAHRMRLRMKASGNSAGRGFEVKYSTGECF